MDTELYIHTHTAMDAKVAEGAPARWRPWLTWLRIAAVAAVGLCTVMDRAHGAVLAAATLLPA